MSRLIHARMLLAVAIAITIGVLELGSLIAPKAQVSAQQISNVSTLDTVATLSTIRVSAPEDIPTLPLVIVRPDVGQTFDDVSTQTVAFVSQRASDSSSSGSSHMPHVRLDMPYYSFGKMLPNVIKD